MARPLRSLAAGLLFALAGPSMAAPATTPTAHHTISYDRYSLSIDGKRLVVWSGEFHYWRLPSPDLWRDVLQKMKSGGYNAVSIYFHWGFHSPRRGVYDFGGIRDVDRLLDMAAEAGIYVIARPGPYVNAETEGGGLPAWLATEAGKPRSTAPDYTAAYREWVTHIDAILARHQLTDGRGTVILYQIENELYERSNDSARYLRAIQDKGRADGITVPFMGNHNAGFQGTVGAVELPGYDSYPQGFDCSHPEQWKGFYAYRDERKALTKSPLFFPEYQGGAFDTWGGAGYDRCRQLTGPQFERVFYESTLAAGSTMMNFYMTYGGTNWGWLASPGVYTSYDYAAPISEGRTLTTKYDQQKLIGYMLRSVAPFAHTDAFAAKAPDNPALHVEGRINPDDGTRFYFLRHGDVTSNGDNRTHLQLDIADAKGSGTHRVSVPQQPGTALRVHGRDAKILLANYRFGAQQLSYSTSDWLTSVSDGTRDVAVLYGRAGEDGETVLRYAHAPKVRVLAGTVTSHWDEAARTLRLDYRHEGLARVAIEDGDHTLLLLLGDNASAARFWQLDSSHGPVLAYGPYLVRNATLENRTLALTGDTAQPGPLEIFAPADIDTVRWNDETVAMRATPSASHAGALPGPVPVNLPALAHWRSHAGAPEIAPAFDDGDWQRADRKTTASPFWDGRRPILNADEYGFHHGDVWYRGRFTAKGTERNLLLDARTGIHDGNNGVASVWLNGHWLDTREGGPIKLPIDPSLLKPGQDNMIAVLVANMGHNQEGHSGDSQEPRGLASATLTGARTPIDWKIQGSRGGESPVDPVRGPFNSGGLYGERMGWSLPGFPDASWQATTLPQRTTQPGVDWYRTAFDMDLPAGQDVPVALKIDDDPGLHYRALIFVNGWQVGRYVNDRGPQHVFPIPAGLLDPHGHNTLAIAVWNTQEHGGLGKVSLVQLGNVRTSLRISQEQAPAYDREIYKP